MYNTTPEYNFTNIISATERVLRLLNKDNADSSLKELVQELLQYAAGNQNTVPIYRPWYVAATVLSQDIVANNLTEAEGVKFKDKTAIVNSFMATQRSLDLSLNLEIPLGFSADAFLLQQSGVPVQKKRSYGSSSTSATFSF